MYVELPAVTATPEQRLKALQDAKTLLATTPGETKPAIFGGGSVESVYAPDTAEMIRLAEYITTGHDYKDTHPNGKRRPIIKQTAHVTVVAPTTPDEEDIEHLLHHLFNGDFDMPGADEDGEASENDLSREERENYSDNGAHNMTAEERAEGLDGK